MVLNSSSQSVALDMGDMGKLTMSDYNMAGIGTIQDMVPNGGEQPWDDYTVQLTVHLNKV